MAVGSGDLAAFINSLTEATSPDTANDMLILRKAADGSLEKISPVTIASGVTPAFVKIAESVLTGTAASFDFTSIPSTWRHLRIYMVARGDAAGSSGLDVHMTFNGDTGSNYDAQFTGGNNTTATTSAVAASAVNYVGNIPRAGDTANMCGSVEITIFDYHGTTFYKRYLSHAAMSIGTAASNQSMRLSGGQWRSTSAITRVTLTPASGNFAAGSVCTLYGML